MVGIGEGGEGVVGSERVEEGLIGSKKKGGDMGSEGGGRKGLVGSKGRRGGDGQ